MHEMITSYLKGDTKKSLKLQLDMLALIRALFIEVSPVPVKAALNLMGFDVGKARMPLIQIEDANLAKLKIAMKDYGL
jgi:4-hydroxy-tetrahydrodipicolinate synthase